MAISIKEWEEKKRIIEKEKEKLSVNKGKKESILARLEKDFGCTSIEEGEEKLASLRKKREQYETQLEEIFNELEAYDWSV